MSLSLIFHHRSPVFMVMMLSGFRSGTLCRTNTGTSISQEFTCTILPGQLTATTYKINSVSASSRVLGMLTMFSWKEMDTFLGVCGDWHFA